MSDTRSLSTEERLGKFTILRKDCEAFRADMHKENKNGWWRLMKIIIASIIFCSGIVGGALTYFSSGVDSVKNETRVEVKEIKKEMVEFALEQRELKITTDYIKVGIDKIDKKLENLNDGNSNR